MVSRKRPSKPATPAGDRIVVVDEQGRRPFMRGIMVHSLTARGVPFDEALRTADRVRRRLRGRQEVARDELASLVASMIGDRALADVRPIPATIEVGGSRRSVPFSKGVLSQSLLAAAIDPTDAFDVARDIELALHRRGTTRITRRTLRKMAFEALLYRFDEATAERFMIWRQHQEPDRPVIVLLGGTTGAGKTSIALEVALRLGIRRVLSTDSIRQVMRIMLSRDLAPALHASSFDAHRVAGLELPGANRVVEGFLQQTATVSVGVRAMLDRAVEEHTSLVLDGVSIVPGQIGIAAYAEDAHVIPLLVARLDERAFRSHFHSRGSEGSRRGMKRYLQSFDHILEIQNHLLELAEQYHVPIVDNRSVESSVRFVIRHVVETLRDRGEQAEPELPYATR
jgi:2-phosphoglycerate kinase